MSFFDPQQIYRKGTYYTKKGQIIQKRPVKRDGPLSVKDRDRAIRVVEAFGYYVIKPEDMPQPPEPVTTIYEKALSIPFTFRQWGINNNTFTLTFNDMFNVIGSSMDTVLLYADKAIDVLIEPTISSIFASVSGSSNQQTQFLTNKINTTLNTAVNDRINLFPDTINDFNYIMASSSSSSSVYNQANFNSTDNLTLLSYFKIDDIESYAQLCNNHALDDDIEIFNINTSTGTVNGLVITFNMSIRVQYLDDVEPYS